MNDKFAWASIGSNGKASGDAAGDNNGKEVKVGTYYSFGQDKCIRFVNKKKGRRAARIARLLANDNSVGYSQSDRYGFWNVCANNEWNWNFIKKKIKKGTLKKCNTDCSQFATCVINLTFGYDFLPKEMTTSNLASKLQSYKKRFDVINISKAEGNWQKGDMPIKAGKHVIIKV